MAYFKVLSRRIYGRNTTRLRHDNAGNSAPYPTAYRKRAKASKRFGINPKTVAKWCKRTSTEKAVRGPRPASTVLTPAEEAAIVLFRQQPLLPLDNWLCALQEAIPQLSRSALHHCFQCHGISCLSPSEELGETQKSLSAIPSAISTRILPRCKRKKVNRTCSSPLTARVNGPSPNYTTRPPR